MKKRNAIIITAIILSGVVVFAGYNIVAQIYAYQRAGSEYDYLSEVAKKTENRPSPSPGVSVSGGPLPSPGVSEGGIPSPSPDASGGGTPAPQLIYQSPIDFHALAEINPDVAGWIFILGTVIDYPVVKGGDNEKYLHFTYSGERNASGAIFMDARNTADFSDKNSIVYGHRMKNGSMFAAITGYKNQDFFAAHPVFTLYTPNHEYSCEVFSAYVTDAASPTYRVDFDVDDDFERYIADITALSLIDTGITVTGDEKILTLSTCDRQSEDARMVVHARMTAIQ